MIPPGWVTLVSDYPHGIVKSLMLECRLSNKDEYTILSCSDIQTLLKHFLPRRDVTALGGATTDGG